MKKILQLLVIAILGLGGQKTLWAAIDSSEIVSVLGGSGDTLVTRRELERLISRVKIQAERNGTVTDLGSEGKVYKLDPIAVQIAPLDNPSAGRLIDGKVEPVLRIRTLRATPRPLFLRELNLNVVAASAAKPLEEGIAANILAHRNNRYLLFGQLEVWVTRGLREKLPIGSNHTNLYLNLVRRVVAQLAKRVK
ncbi:MAG: hypothetical protein HY401_04955 [Elusimicrobia bacterium]|nr:hypothetical protein [Elusimicrobiota bacterium]